MTGSDRSELRKEIGETTGKCLISSGLTPASALLNGDDVALKRADQALKHFQITANVKATIAQAPVIGTIPRNGTSRDPAGTAVEVNGS